MGEPVSAVIEPNRLYRVEQVGEILGLNAGSVRRLIRKGGLVGRHIGRRWFVLGSDLLKAGVTEPEPHREPEPQVHDDGKRKRKSGGKSDKTMSAGDRWRAMVSMRASGAGPE